MTLHRGFGSHTPIQFPVHHVEFSRPLTVTGGEPCAHRPSAAEVFYGDLGAFSGLSVDEVLLSINGLLAGGITQTEAVAIDGAVRDLSEGKTYAPGAPISIEITNNMTHEGEI